MLAAMDKASVAGAILALALSGCDPPRGQGQCPAKTITGSATDLTTSSGSYAGYLLDAPAYCTNAAREAWWIGITGTGTAMLADRKGFALELQDALDRAALDGVVTTPPDPDPRNDVHWDCWSALPQVVVLASSWKQGDAIISVVVDAVVARDLSVTTGLLVSDGTAYGECYYD